MREERQAAEGLSQKENPPARAISRMSLLVRPASRNGWMIPSLVLAVRPGRYSPVSETLMPSATQEKPSSPARRFSTTAEFFLHQEQRSAGFVVDRSSSMTATGRI